MSKFLPQWLNPTDTPWDAAKRSLGTTIPKVAKMIGIGRSTLYGYAEPLANEYFGTEQSGNRGPGQTVVEMCLAAIEAGQPRDEAREYIRWINRQVGLVGIELPEASGSCRELVMEFVALAKEFGDVANTLNAATAATSAGGEALTRDERRAIHKELTELIQRAASLRGRIKED